MWGNGLSGTCWVQRDGCGNLLCLRCYSIRSIWFFGSPLKLFLGTVLSHNLYILQPPFSLATLHMLCSVVGMDRWVVWWIDEWMNWLMDGWGCQSLFWAWSIACRLHQATVNIHYIRDNLMSMEFNGFLWLCCIFPNWFRVVLKYVFILYIIMQVIRSRRHWASSHRRHTKRSSTAPQKQNSRFNITLTSYVNY